MEFLYPQFLLIAVPIVLFSLLFKRIEKRRYLDIPTKLIVRQIGGLKFFVRKSGKILWALAAILLVVVLARPQDVSEAEKFNVEGREMILSVDLSTSMSSTSYSKTGRSSVDVLKDLSLEFAKKRATTDFVGITAYGGRGFGRNDGEAAIIVFPTSEYVQLEASIKILKPQMLGCCTAIGEGIMRSILSLVDQDALKKISIEELVKSIEGADKNYALDFVRKIGRFRNKIIILFTDGKNNAGISPEHPLWLSRMLGIKVYFAALESTGATGLSPAEQERQKNLLIQGVLETGGKYYEMNIVEQIEEFYKEIDRLETAKLEFGTFEKREDLYFWSTLLAMVLVGASILLENLFPRIQ